MENQYEDYIESEKNWEVIDISKDTFNFANTVREGNLYRDNMGFDELWVITKIHKDRIYLVSITNQWRPTLVTDYEEDFLYCFAAMSIVDVKVL